MGAGILERHPRYRSSRLRMTVPLSLLLGAPFMVLPPTKKLFIRENLRGPLTPHLHGSYKDPTVPFILRRVWFIIVSIGALLVLIVPRLVVARIKPAAWPSTTHPLRVSPLLAIKALGGQIRPFK